MERRSLSVKCPENQLLADHMLIKWEELADKKPNGLSENIEKTLANAYATLCASKNPVLTIRDFSQIKGVGKWIMKLMQGFFKADSGVGEPEETSQKGKKTKGVSRYLPQKNSVPYALLITLYRGTLSGNKFMRKQELIDAAEASGLSRAPIAPELGKGKAGAFSESKRDWYSGWASMKTLISKALVVKSSCPAKYMLTEEGKEAARGCITRSGLTEALDTGTAHDPETESTSDVEIIQSHSEMETTSSSLDLRRKKSKDIPSDYFEGLDSTRKVPIDIPSEVVERLVKMGYSKERILKAYHEVSKAPGLGSTWLSVLCHLREGEVYSMESQRTEQEIPTTSTPDITIGEVRGQFSHQSGNMPKTSGLRACSSSKSPGGRGAGSNILPMPPLSFCETFEDVYEVILILDNREQFANKGSRSSKIIESVCSQFKIKIEVRHLPVGDAIWIAHHKTLMTEYVLDFIVERKKVDDLRSSIRDNRYKDQKLRLLRCGLQKLIYLIEGDPNASEAAESLKTACFTTEILEGFDVQRTSGLGDTLKRYGFLTQAIAQYYKAQIPEDWHKSTKRVCPLFGKFIKKCEELDKMTVNDLFAIQLMQVPQVTEEIALAVADLYPTILSLANAYSLLDGDIAEQREMLRKQTNNAVSSAASRNIFQLVWGN